MTGTVFDIKEFALNDGDGIRTTVFLKGCPLRCIWCHNPEGLSPAPELYIKTNGCRECGLCKTPCNHPECKSLGRCTKICPVDLISVVGKSYTANELCEKLLRGASILNSSGGGVTISGGEPLLQSDFVIDVLKKLKGHVHRAIETSGYADASIFSKVVSECDAVMMDIKLIDDDLHKKYTGVSNKKILENARYLMNCGTPYVFRIPLIPGITDTEENLSEISDFVGNSRVELLSYNTLAPAKYRSVGRKFTTEINPDIAKRPNLAIFKNATLKL